MPDEEMAAVPHPLRSSPPASSLDRGAADQPLRGSTVISHPDGLGTADVTLLAALLPTARAQGADTMLDVGM
ncbi:hypothetical protein [Streptomyces sp. NPDC050848]|uniref:hypothetical protein n=1 Tax=Streptomyces sp. NPDC050848 TaxID=3155791 RepID=UPI0033C5B666